MRHFKVWLGTCKQCKQDMIGFELLQRKNSVPNKSINWQHADGKFYRHNNEVIGIHEYCQGEI